MSYKLRATNLQNVSKGNTATLRLPVGKNAPTLDKVILQLGGTSFLKSHITSIVGKANGRPFYNEGSGTLISNRDVYKGIAVDAAFLAIDFTESKARNGAVEQLLSSVPMSMLQDLSFEITLASGAPADATLNAQIIVRQPTNNPFILKKLQTTQAFSASGEQIVYLPTGGAGGKIKRIWIHELSAGHITDVRIQVGNSIAFETNRLQLEFEQKRNGLVPQAGIVVVDFVEDGNLAGVLDTGAAGNVELRITADAANTYTVYYELIDPIGRL